MVTDPQGYAREVRTMVYVVAPLAECRAAFERTIGQRVEWPEGDDPG
jgi:hypothetical protein